ncbi:MAG TPA: Smr/MutS family protein, partial [bacterium]|nr:Smr/MutS family protein [bacterium]
QADGEPVQRRPFEMMQDEDSQEDAAEPVEIPIDGVLDLHAFQPREVADLVNHYLDECRARGILHVRIIHGKGTGSLRELVRSILGKREDVVKHRLDSQTPSGWGATLVELRPAPPRV